MTDAHPSKSPGRVLLFSGHMIDAPGRARPRFPAALEPVVAQAVDAKLAALGAGAGDVGISSAACGSDILFAEAALARGVRLRVYLPFEEPTFIEKSVSFANARWTERFREIVARAEVFVAPRTLGPLPEDTDPYERTNLWMLAEAQRIGGSDVEFICVWDGRSGDGAGGTRHMTEAVREAGGSAHRIDIRRLRRDSGSESN